MYKSALLVNCLLSVPFYSSLVVFSVYVCGGVSYTTKSISFTVNRSCEWFEKFPSTGWEPQSPLSQLICSTSSSWWVDEFPPSSFGSKKMRFHHYYFNNSDFPPVYVIRLSSSTQKKTWQTFQVSFSQTKHGNTSSLPHRIQSPPTL